MSSSNQNRINQLPQDIQRMLRDYVDPPRKRAHRAAQERVKLAHKRFGKTYNLMRGYAMGHDRPKEDRLSQVPMDIQRMVGEYLTPKKYSHVKKTIKRGVRAARENRMDYLADMDPNWRGYKEAVDILNQYDYGPVEAVDSVFRRGGQLRRGNRPSVQFARFVEYAPQAKEDIRKVHVIKTRATRSANATLHKKYPQYRRKEKALAAPRHTTRNKKKTVASRLPKTKRTPARVTLAQLRKK